ncbi:hypothetical protein D3C80_964190 [compost metagenome]
MEIATFPSLIIKVGGTKLTYIEANVLFVAAMMVLLVDLRAMDNIFRGQHTVAEKMAWGVGLLLFPVFGLALWGIYDAERKRVELLKSERFAHARVSHQPY